MPKLYASQRRKRFYNSEHGFTLFELFWVILLVAALGIGIIYAYGYANQRSRDAALESTATQYVKILRKVASKHGGSVPITRPACIGTSNDYDATANFAKGQCFKMDNVSVTVSRAFNAAVQNEQPASISGAYPSVSGTLGNQAETFARGMYFQPGGSGIGSLIYVIPNDQACLAMFTRDSSDVNSLAYCYYIITANQ